MSRIKCNPEYNRKMNFIIDSPTTDVCDEDPKQVLSGHQPSKHLSGKQKLKIAPCPKLIHHVNTFHNISVSRVPQIKQLSLRDPAFLKGGEIGSPASGCPGSLVVLEESPHFLSPKFCSAGKNVASQSSFFKRTETTKPSAEEVLILRRPLQGDSKQAIRTPSVRSPQLGLSAFEEAEIYSPVGILTRKDFHLQHPAPKVHQSPTIESKLLTYTRAQSGSGAKKFLKEVHHRSKSNAPAEMDPLPQSETIQVGSEAGVPLRQLHPRIQTIIVGEHPSQNLHSQNHIIGMASPETDLKHRTQAKIPAASPSLLASQPHNTSRKQSATTSRSLSRIPEYSLAQNAELRSTPSNVVRLKAKYGGAILYQPSAIARVQGERTASTPSSSINLFLRTKTLIDDVVLSPQGHWSSPPDLPVRSLLSQHVLAGSHPDLEAILKKDSKFTAYVQGRQQQQQRVKAILQLYAQSKPSPGVGELIEYGLRLCPTQSQAGRH